jgi:hypothetical protein
MKRKLPLLKDHPMVFALQLVKLIRPRRRVASGFLSQSMQDCSRRSREVILLDSNDFFSHLLDVFGLC